MSTFLAFSLMLLANSHVYGHRTLNWTEWIFPIGDAKEGVFQTRPAAGLGVFASGLDSSVAIGYSEFSHFTNITVSTFGPKKHFL